MAVLVQAGTPEQVPLVGLDAALVEVDVVVAVVVAPLHALMALQSPLGSREGADDAYHLACHM